MTSDDTKNPERRTEARASPPDKLAAQVNSPSAHLDASALDVSVSGLRIRSMQPLAVGASVELQLRSGADREGVAVTGTIRWVMNVAGGGFEAGLSLDGFPSEHLIEWMALVKDGSDGGPVGER